ncbi:MAG: hypothetical protein HOP16_18605 [Acidobacteria bacterium]|nr:hypothetical protein [Acidobacteriota bacterium]
MRLPFTDTQFFDVLAAYNTVLWPAGVALWIVSLTVTVLFVSAGRRTSRALCCLLAGHWAWSGIAYHATFFTRINPAGWLFAALFVTEALLLVWYGVLHDRLRFSTAGSTRHVLAAALIAYSFAYPFLNIALGLEYPRIPLFAVPCPTTLFTAGLLLIAERPPVGVLIVPVLWSVVATSAAVLFHVRADFMLFPAALLLVVFAAMDHRARYRRGRSGHRIANRA